MFITLEGIEGCGKTTLIGNLQKKLTELGHKVLCTREPGSSPLGKHIRPLLLEFSSSPLSSEAELLLFLADRAEHVEKIILPALAENTIVLCDRYCHSTFAYQGYGRGFNISLLQSLNAFACKNLMPDITFLLDLPVEIGLGRANSRNFDDKSKEGRFEAESLNFHQKVREGFLACAENNNNFFVLDATLAPDTLALLALNKILNP